MSSAGQDRMLDDANIKGGSPTDRIIGMLLERTEAMRELHESLREEYRGLIDTHADIKNMMVRISDKLEAHEKTDVAAFAAVNASNASIGGKIDKLRAEITAATTASVIQKAQLNAGWKVIVVIGGIVISAFTVFAIFYNHLSR